MRVYFRLSNKNNEVEQFRVRPKNCIEALIAKANHFSQTNDEKMAVRNAMVDSTDKNKWDNFVERSGGIENVILYRA